jgi:hypothetical protein
MALAPHIAYARLARTISSLEGSKLHPDEAGVLRAAGDARLFGDADADARLTAAGELVGRLERDERITTELAEHVLEQLDSVRHHDDEPVAA